MQRIAKLLVTLFVLLFTAISAQGEIWYVSNDGDDGANDGLSIGSPFATIGKALNEADGNDTIRVEGNGDVYDEAYLRVTSTQNDLRIIGWDFTADEEETVAANYPVLDYDGTTQPRLGFSINADNVTIRNFKIQDFVALTDGENWGSDGGAAVLVLNQTSGHVFENIDIYNCTWGFYLALVSETQILSCNIDLNDNGKVNGSGGVGIMLWTDDTDITMDQNYVGVDMDGVSKSVTIQNCPVNGIQFGNDADDVNADGSYIQNTLIYDCGDAGGLAETEGYGIALWNLTGSVDVSSCTITVDEGDGNQYYGMYLSCLTIDESNTDVYAHDNLFVITEDVIIRADEDFAGAQLYNIWLNNDNSYGGSVKHSAAALTDDDEVTDSRTQASNARYIRYNIQDAIDDADNGERVRVAEGTYEECLDVPVSIEIFSSDDTHPELHIIQCDQVLTDPSTTFPTNQNPQHEMYASDIEFHGFQFESSAGLTNQVHMMGILDTDNEIYNNIFMVPNSSSYSVGITTQESGTLTDDGAGGLLVHDNEFADGGGTGNGYYGVYLWGLQSTSPAGDNINVYDNTFDGPVYGAVSTSRSKVDITGNTVDGTLSTPSGTFPGAGEGWFGFGVVGTYAIDDVLIQCNTVDDAFLAGAYIGTASSSLTNIEVYTNTYGATYYNVYAGVADGVQVYYHSFTDGNYTDAAVYSNSSGTLDIRYNYWGASAGPTHPDNTYNVTLQGADIKPTTSGTFLFAPWWTSFTDGCPETYASGDEISGPVYVYNAAETVLRDMYPSIQSAIDDPTTVNTDHIIVIEGSFTEQVTIDKEVYLRGKKPGTGGIPDGTADAWTNGTAGTGSGPMLIYNSADPMVYIDADNVTMRGFNFLMASGAEKSVAYNGSYNNAYFEYNTFEMEDSDYGFFLDGGYDINVLQVNYNTFEASSGSSATFFMNENTSSSVTNVTMNHNEVTGHNIAWIDLGEEFSSFIFRYNTLADGGLTFDHTGVTSDFDDFNIEYNTFSDGANAEPALYFTTNVVEGAEIDDWDNCVEFHYNTVLTSGDPAVGFQNSAISAPTTDLDARWNWWNSANGPAVKNDGNYTFTDLEGNQYEYPNQGSIVTPDVDFVRWYNNATLTVLYGPIWNNDSPKEYYASAHDAMSGTDAAGIITFDDGTFAFVTDLNVDKSIKLVGQGYSTTTVLDGQYKNSPADAPWIVANGSDPMIDVAADNVTIEGFKIDLGNDDNDYDIGINNSTSSSINTLYINDNWMLFADSENTPNEKLIYIGDGTSIFVEDNLLEAADANHTMASASITVFDFKNNTVKPYPVADGGVDDVDAGSGFAYWSDGSMTNVNSTISGNSFSYSGAVQVGYGTGANNTITITCNEFLYNNTDALSIKSSSTSYPTSTITITYNSFMNTTDDAIWIHDENSNQDINNIVINYNIFDNIGGYALNVEDNSMADAVDARYNWWGDEYGPDHSSNAWYSGSGGTRDGEALSYSSYSVTWVPYWTDYSGSVCSYSGTEFGPVMRADQEEPAGAVIDAYYASIKAAIDDPTTVDGDFIWVTDGTYIENGIDVDKQVTIVGKKADQQTSAYTVLTPGMNAGPTVLNDNTDAYVFNIMANNVTMKGMEIITDGSPDDAVKVGSYNNFWLYYSDINMSNAGNVGVNVPSTSSFTSMGIDYNEFFGACGEDPIFNNKFLNLGADAQIDDLDFMHNKTYRSMATIGVGDGNKDNLDFNNNEFYLADEFCAPAGIFHVEGVSGASMSFSSTSFTYNLFQLMREGQYAFYFDSDVPDGAAPNGWYTDWAIAYNNFDIAPSDDQEAIDFLVSSPSASLNAECNWWDSIDGPTAPSNTKVGTLGAACTAGVDFLPWLSNGNDSQPAQVGHQTTASCNTAIVMRSSSSTYGENIIDYYASIQAAVNDANDGDFIHISNGSYDENVSIIENVGFVNNGDTYVVDDDDADGNLNLTTNSKTLTLYDHFWFEGTLTLNTGGFAELQDYNLYIGGNMINNGLNLAFIHTNGTGSLYKYNAEEDEAYTFPIGINSDAEYLPVLIEARDNFLSGSMLSARVDDNNPTIGRKGEASYATNHTYFLGAYQPDGTEYPETTDIDAELVFTIKYNTSAGANFTPNISYGARWDDVTELWTSYRIGGSHTTDEVQVVSAEHLSAWGIFSGTSSFALSNLPTPAQLILFRHPANPDTELRIRWNNGNGSGVAVVMEQATALTAADYPNDGQYYTGVPDASSVVFGSASSETMTGGAQLIYKNNNVTRNTEQLMITGLQPGTDYIFGVFSFNGVDDQTNYYTDIDPTPDDVRRNSRGNTTWPRGSMLVSNGAGPCTVDAPMAARGVDDCEIVCYNGSFDLDFGLEGGVAGTNVRIRYSDGFQSQLVPSDPGMGSFPFSYTVTNVTAESDYTLLNIRDNDGNPVVIDEDRNKAHIQLNIPPTISLNTPVPSEVCEGNSITVTANVSGSPLPQNPTWQYYNSGWYDLDVAGGPNFGGSTGQNTASATGDQITFSNLDFATADGQMIRVVYDNVSGCGAATAESSNSVTLNVDQLPNTGTGWTTSSFDWCSDESIDLVYDLTGWVSSGTFKWQYQNGSWADVPDPSADFTINTVGNTTTLSIDGTTPWDYDGYDFRIVFQNGVCSPTSDTWSTEQTVSISQNPSVTGIDQDPTTQVCDGESKTLWVTYDVGTPTWYKNGSMVTPPTGSYTEGATSASWTVESEDGDYYDVVVTNGNCSVSATQLTLSGAPAPVIDETLLADQTACQDDGSVEFITTVTGATSMQWYYDDGTGFVALTNAFGGSPAVSGHTSASLTLTDVPVGWDGYEIELRATNGICERTSTVMQVWVNDPPVILGAPLTSVASSTICVNGSYSASGLANSTACGVVVADWYTDASGSWVQLQDGVDHYGATVSIAVGTLDLTNIPASWDGAQIKASFTCAPCDPVETAAATITVDDVPAAPTGLAASAAPAGQRATSFRLDWTDDPDVDDYYVTVVETSSGNATAVTDQATGGDNFYTIAECTLDPGTEYSAWIYAENHCGMSDESATVNYTTASPTVAVTSQSGTTFPDTDELTPSSTSYSFTVNVSDLDYDLVVEVQPDGGNYNYEVWDGSAWQTTVTTSAPVADGDHTFWVRFYPKVIGADIVGDIDVYEDATCYTPSEDDVEFHGRGLAAPPTQNASNIVFTDNVVGTTPTNGQFTFDFDFGNATGGYMIVLAEDDGDCTVDFEWTPTDNTTYSENGNWDAGNAFTYNGTEYCVVDYVGIGAGENEDVTIGGLDYTKDYVVKIFAYNGSAGTERYNSDDEAYNPWLYLELAFDQTGGNGPADLEYTHEIFDEIVTYRFDRTGDLYTCGDADYTLDVVDATTSNTFDLQDGDLYNNTGTIPDGDSEDDIDDFRWDSHPDIDYRGRVYFGDGRAFNKLRASADGYVSGYTDNDGWNPAGDDGFVLRASEPYRQARLVDFSTRCDGGEKELLVDWSKGRYGSGRVAVMNEGSAPDLPVDGEQYDEAFTGAKIDFPNCDVVPSTGTDSRAIQFGDETETDGWVTNLNSGASIYHYVKVSEYRWDGSNEETINYLSSLGTNNPNSQLTTNCYQGLGGIYVELDQYNAKSYERKAYLDWVTTFEQGIVGFELYRADLTNTPWDAPTLDYVKVGSFLDSDNMIAQGGTNNRYLFVDDDPSLEVGVEYQYKLVAVGIDGQKIKLANREVIILTRPLESGTVYLTELKPNPAVDHVNFRLELQAEENVTIEVLDVTGKKVATVENGKLYSPGAYEINIPLGDVVSGTYILNVSTGSEMVIRKFVVAR